MRVVKDRYGNVFLEISDGRDFEKFKADVLDAVRKKRCSHHGRTV